MSNMKDNLAQTPFTNEVWPLQTSRPSALSSLFSVQTLKQAALKIADVRRGKGFNTGDLVGLLMGHAARNRRLSQPRALMRMRLPVNANKITVRLTIPR